MRGVYVSKSRAQRAAQAEEARLVLVGVLFLVVGIFFIGAVETLTHSAPPPAYRLIGEVPSYSGCSVTNGGTYHGTTQLVVTRCWPQ